LPADNKQPLTTLYAKGWEVGMDRKASPERVAAERIAQKFHEVYERLAPQFGYVTRKESAKPWAEVPENNRNLMIAVCEELGREAYAGEAKPETVIGIPVRLDPTMPRDTAELRSGTSRVTVTGLASPSDDLVRVLTEGLTKISQQSYFSDASACFDGVSPDYKAGYEAACKDVRKRCQDWLERAERIAENSQIGEGKNMEWISVKERLPELTPIFKDGPRSSGLVLVFSGHYVFCGKYEETLTTRKARWESVHGRLMHVTHWMPLPEPPKN